MTEENNQAQTGDGPNFGIVRIYLKDVSFETPNSPEVFRQDFKPDVNLQLNTSVNKLQGELFEVVLNVTVTSKQGDKTGFLVEVQQAGIFELKGFDEAQKGPMLGAYCPNTLYPFAREAVSDLVVKGGFPPLLLSPFNFDALYTQKMKQAEAQAASSGQAAH
ncbi:MAG: protein-export chaperone SecB [Pseudomonadota bacterium]|nr:protein-export chaperone SecB [Pseudomonadota bacterium]